MCLFAQQRITGVIKSKDTDERLPSVQIYDKLQERVIYSDYNGNFELFLDKAEQDFMFMALGYNFLEKKISKDDHNIIIQLEVLGEELNEVIIDKQQKKIFGVKHLKEVEGTAIYAGKKSEVVLMDQVVMNKASANPRQTYAQIAGLNIYETDDAGLQLNIGGRGLDPNRSANFNTRQNGYDISADVLGYPESYYTPPVEAIEEIQIVRGAASLQYGTQFGGLVNFKLKKPESSKPLSVKTRQGIGSFGLFNSFTSLSGTVNKVSYYTYGQVKTGDGFRDNSNFLSSNLYAQVNYQLSPKTKISFESSYLDYLAQQAGGMNDYQFNEDPTFSNRTRNFFNVNWKLLNLKLEHEISKHTQTSLNIFHLNAYRKAIGFRDERTTETDNLDRARELLVDEFINWGAEAKLLTKYNVFKRKSIFLVGTKYYQSANSSQQGLGSNGTDANFTFYNDEFPNQQARISSFNFPNLNASVFAENIFKLTNHLSITPGIRFEYIKTVSEGSYTDRFIPNGELYSENTTEENRTNERNFVLLGLGVSYKPSLKFECFANFSQNYRSLTFSNIRVDNPSLIIDENIADESGYTSDIGIRGSLGNIFRYDTSAYALLYDNRIGQYFSSEVDVENGNIEPSQVGRIFRTNLGTALIYGIENLTTLNFSNWLLPEGKDWHWQQFLNVAYTFSEYTEAQRKQFVGNEVEFIPKLNLKTGLELGYKNFKSSLQYTFVSTQFTDIQNSPANLDRSSLHAINGEIPAYEIIDLSLEYTHKKWKFETGINNLLNESYFTRRATGYPGPGIIPSNPRNFYGVIQYQF